MDKHYRWLGSSGASGLGYGLAGLGRCGARQQGAWPLLGLDPGRRRHDVCAGRTVDRGPSRHSAAHRDATTTAAYHQEVMHLQAPVQPAQSRGEPRQDRRPDSAPASTARMSTTQVSRAGRRAGGPRARSPIRRDLGPALKEAVEVVKKGQPRSSIPLPSRVEVKHMRLVRSTLVRSFGLAALAAGLGRPRRLWIKRRAAAGDAAKGKENFMKYGCWQCHGTVGRVRPSAARSWRRNRYARSDVVLHPEQPAHNAALSG